MNIYKPTWLYIKKHNQTGLKYFGKTTGKDPIKYPGSGKYWVRHLVAHSNDTTTIWCHLYDNKETLMEEAIAFSKYHNISNSSEWANLKPENGVDGGGAPGRTLSDKTKQKIGDSNRGRKMSKEFCQMRSEKQKGKIPWNKGLKGALPGHNKGKKFGTPSDEYRINMSNILKGKPKPPRSKEHCENISKANTGKPGHPHSEESKKKIGEKNSGRRKMYHPELKTTTKMVLPTQIKEFLINGWKFSRELVSTTAKVPIASQ
jgi:hypothetical protein